MEYITTGCLIRTRCAEVVVTSCATTVTNCLEVTITSCAPTVIKLNQPHMRRPRVPPIQNLQCLFRILLEPSFLTTTPIDPELLAEVILNDILKIFSCARLVWGGNLMVVDDTVLVNRNQ